MTVLLRYNDVFGGNFGTEFTGKTNILSLLSPPGTRTGEEKQRHHPDFMLYLQQAPLGLERFKLAGEEVTQAQGRRKLPHAIIIHFPWAALGTYNIS